MKNVRRKRVTPYTNKLFLILILVSVIFMGIGYASINSISLDVSGEMIAQSQDGLFITEVSYAEENSSQLNEKYEIYHTDSTILKSKITLEQNNVNSEISLKVSFYNNSEYDYIFTDVIYANELTDISEEIYSNYDIVYTFNNQNEIISKNGGTLDVIITFKYNQLSESTSNILTSTLNFKFKKTYSITYSNISNTSNLPMYGIENESLVIDFTDSNYYYFAIFMGENKLVLNEDYTFDNMILTIYDVNNYLKISTFGAVTNGLITVSNQYTNTSNMYGDFSSLAADVDLSNSQGKCTYVDCYSDNNGNFEYTDDGGLVFDANNQIGILNIDDSMKIGDEFTAYITLKADANQIEPNEKYATAAIAMSFDGSPYLFWIGFYDGYLHIYSYKRGNMSQCNYDVAEEGFLSINAAEYSNKIINIQVVASRGNETKLYINGNLISTFATGSEEINYSQATLGDLRPGRGLKFEGIIYDVALYNRALTSDEVSLNWNYANEIWKIE